VSVNELIHNRQLFNTLIPPSHESPLSVAGVTKFSRLFPHCTLLAVEFVHMRSFE